MIDLNNEIQLTKTRKSNLELLRILAMFFIVLHHLIVHGMRNVGYLPYPFEIICLNKQIPLILLNSFAVVSVNCYVLISGYFGIIPTKKKLWNLFTLCVFYSVGHYLVYAFLFDSFPLRPFISSLFPFSHNQGLWFVTCYIGLFFISPLLNASVGYLNGKKEIEWIMVLGGLAIITFYFGYLWGTELNYDGYNLVNFIFLYMIGRYLYVKNKFLKINNIYMIGTYIICTFITASLGVLFLIYKERADYLFYWVWRYNSPFVILGAIALFLFFNSLKVCSKKVNYIAASTFSVYLIHENYHVKMILYNNVNDILSNMNIVIMMVCLVVLALFIFIGCLVIDFIRRYLFATLFKNIICGHKYFKKHMDIK